MEIMVRGRKSQLSEEENLLRIFPWEAIQLYVPSHCEEMMENANIFFMFYIHDKISMKRVQFYQK